MSRNFELLQRAAREDLLTPSGFVLPLEESAASGGATGEPANHEIAKLVQRLFFPGGQIVGPRVVSFSGIERDDRSGWICARAAEALAAQTDDLVCVVDANFGSPQLHTHFLAGNRAGLSAALTAEGSVRSFATVVARENLWLMPAGSSEADPTANLGRYRSRLSELRKEFSYILISAPSLSQEAEATLIAQLADGVVLIVEANKSRRESIRRAKERLETAQAQLFGAVLDRRTLPIPERLYQML